MRRFRSFNHSTCKTALNLLETIYLRLRKIVVKRVTVVKFGVGNRGSDGTGSFRIKVRTVRYSGVHGYGIKMLTAVFGRILLMMF